MKQVMNLFKQKPKKQERKYFYPFDYPSYSSILFQTNRGITSMLQEVEYYRQCAPLNAAIQLITDELANITPYLFNVNKEEFIKTHKFLNILKFPNPDSSYQDFIKQVGSYYLITGNAYIVANGLNPNKPPKELAVIPSQYVIINPGSDGYVENYEITYGVGQTEVFSRFEVGTRFRYYSPDGNEIWHIKEFNPLMNINDLYGMSRLTPIIYEIEQYIQASTHNLSLLERGARPSGALRTDQPISDEQFERLQEQMSSYYQGSQNAGRMLLLENGIEFMEMGQTNKDMDFMALKTNVTNMIYTQLKIPLPLINPEHMTLANMESAILSLYDNSVIPLIRKIYHELSLFLIPRYDDLKGYILNYSQEEITALQPRRTDNLQKMAALNILTINELRAQTGYESIEGGDVVYINSSLVPAGTDTYTQDNLTVPNPMDRNEDLDVDGENEDVEDTTEQEKQNYMNLLREQKNPDNTPKYSEEFIIEMANKYYGK